MREITVELPAGTPNKPFSVIAVTSGKGFRLEMSATAEKNRLQGKTGNGDTSIYFRSSSVPCVQGRERMTGRTGPRIRNQRR